MTVENYQSKDCQYFIKKYELHQSMNKNVQDNSAQLIFNHVNILKCFKCLSVLQLAVQNFTVSYILRFVYSTCFPILQALEGGHWSLQDTCFFKKRSESHKKSCLYNRPISKVGKEEVVPYFQIMSFLGKEKQIVSLTERCELNKLKNYIGSHTIRVPK